MRQLARLVAMGVAGLVLTGCAHDSYREDPHHFSKDSRDNRVACYATEAANEYECVPAYRGYPYVHYRDPFYDPYWGVGFYGYYPAYGYHHHHYPAPSPAPSRGGRWHQRR